MMAISGAQWYQKFLQTGEGDIFYPRRDKFFDNIFTTTAMNLFQ